MISFAIKSSVLKNTDTPRGITNIPKQFNQNTKTISSTGERFFNIRFSYEDISVLVSFSSNVFFLCQSDVNIVSILCKRSSLMSISCQFLLYLHSHDCIKKGSYHKIKALFSTFCYLGGRPGSNRRPSVPQTDALTS